MSLFSPDCHKVTETAKRISEEYFFQKKTRSSLFATQLKSRRNQIAKKGERDFFYHLSDPSSEVHKVQRNDLFQH